MIFSALQKTAVTDDADPRSSAPTERLFVLPAYADQSHTTPCKSVLCRVRVKVAAGTLCADGSAVLTLYVKATDGTWVRVDSSAVILNDQLYVIALPALLGSTTAWLQVTSVVGTSKDHVQVDWAAGGEVPPNVDIGTVNIDTGGGVGLATSAKQDTGNTSLATLNARTAVTATALAASKVLLAAPGTLRAAGGVIDPTAPTATYFVHMLNAASLPGDGAVTHLMSPIVVAHVNGLADEFGFDDRIPVGGIAASVGAVMALSSTLATLTISGAYLLAAGAV